jgi:hypothetical protein
MCHREQRSYALIVNSRFPSTVAAYAGDFYLVIGWMELVIAGNLIEQ